MLSMTVTCVMIHVIYVKHNFIGLVLYVLCIILSDYVYYIEVIDVKLDLIGDRRYRRLLIFMHYL